jgi:hypothetical protein
VIDAVPEFDEAAWAQIGVFSGLVATASRDPELPEAIYTHSFGRPRRVLAEVSKRAVSRGEIAARRDLELIPDVVLGLNFTRMSTGGVPDREYVARVLKAIVYPLLTMQPFPSD